MRGAKRETLATVLFTDIVTSSELVAELGDRRWRTMLARHHAIVRRNLRRYGGKELDTAGDGFFAVFDSQASAVRCACAITEDVRELGIEVRAGVHVGEGEIMGRKVGGMVVHTGARIMATAGAGEVVVSGVLKDLVPGAGFQFADHGAHELKGIPGEWRLFLVTAVDGAPRPKPLEPAIRQERIDAIAPQTFGRRRGVLVAAALVSLVAIASGIIIAKGGSGPSNGGPAPLTLVRRSVLEIDPATNRVVADVPLDSSPASIASSGGYLWIASVNGTVTRLDPETKDVASTGGVPAPCDLSSDARGGVWVGTCNPNGEIRYIDSSLRLTRQVIRAAGVAYEFDALWAEHLRNRFLERDLVTRVDPETGKTLATITVGYGAVGPVFGGGYVWVPNYDGGTVSKIDPTSNQVTTIRGFRSPISAVFAAGSLWVFDYNGLQLDKVDPIEGRITDIVKNLGYQGTSLAGSDSAVWLVDTNEIVRIDPQTAEIVWRTTTPSTGTPNIAIDESGMVWVTVPSA